MIEYIFDNKWLYLIYRKSVNNKYEEYVLHGGDFDERVFIGDDADVEIGTPAKAANVGGEIRERVNLQQHFEEVRMVPFKAF